MKKVVFIMSVFLFACCARKNKKNKIALSEPNTKMEILDNNEKADTIIKVIENEESSINMIIQENRSLEDYKENILNFSKFNLEKEGYRTKEIESIIPINDDEFGYFYSLSYPEDYPESNIELYYLIDSLMLENAINDSGNCLFLYLNLAEFVDGEYADYYFEVIENVVSKNLDKFCNTIYDSLSIISRERLEEIYNRYCKSTN